MELAIDQLLQARKTGYIGMEKGNKDCGAVVLQSYSFEGAVYMHQKKFTIANEIYVEMAGKSLEQGNAHMASDGWYLAHIASKRNNRKDEAYTFLKEGFYTANSVDEEQKNIHIFLLLVIHSFWKPVIREIMIFNWKWIRN